MIQSITTHVYVGVVAVTLALAASTDKTDHEKRLRSLLEQKRDVRVEQLKAAAVRYERGLIGYDQLAEAKVALSRALLALCQTTHQRLAVHGRLIAELKKLVDQREALVKQGRVTDASLRELRIKLLDAQIAMQRELVEHGGENKRVR